MTTSTTPSQAVVVIVNPLGGTLKHYTDGVTAALRGDGHHVVVESIFEPCVAGGTALAWLGRYVRALLRARRTARQADGRVLVTWPVLGHLDRPLVRAALGRHTPADIVMHDPEPLVHARGYTRLARYVASLIRSVSVVAHSAAATRILERHCPNTPLTQLPHPVLPRRIAESQDDQNAMPVVRVLGQFKPDRDVHMLRDLATKIDNDVRLEIVGRGWPAVAGWQVEDTYVSEERLDELMATADAVLVPYRRFFQSGIAFRALELGTPAVGPLDSSMAELYTHDQFLASDCVDSWAAAVAAAIETSPSDVNDIATNLGASAQSDWGTWARGAKRTAARTDHKPTI